jgi:hypothetical protein
MTIMAFILFSSFFILIALLFGYVIRVAIRRADPVRLFGRRPYIICWFAIWLGCTIFGCLVELVFNGKLSLLYIALNLGIAITVLVVTTQITVYRLRDAFLDLRWAYSLLVPIVGLIFGIILMFIPSDYGMSRKLRKIRQAN